MGYDADVVQIIVVCALGLLVYVAAFFYILACRVFFVRPSLARLDPNVLGVYQRLPEAGVYTNNTLPERFRKVHASESDTWINYRVRTGTCVVQLPAKKENEDPSVCYVDEASYGLLIPGQEHSIAWMSDDCHLFVELLTEREYHALAAR